MLRILLSIITIATFLFANKSISVAKDILNHKTNLLIDDEIAVDYYLLKHGVRANFINLDSHHKRTKDLIEYVFLMQGALIPDNNLFRNYFKDYFAIWHPKDLVGGDICLFDELRNDDITLIGLSI